MDYSNLPMRKLVNVYQNYVNDIVGLQKILSDPVTENYAAIRQMYELTMVELNNVLTEIIARLNLKK